MPTTPVPGPWTCPRCGSDRAADDAFCGRCATPRPSTDLSPSPDPSQPALASQPALPGERPSISPVRRSLLLNGAMLVVVAVVVLLWSRPSAGPGAVAFEPRSWRCDGTERAWTADIPASALDVAIEWRVDGPDGALRSSLTTSRESLEAFRTPNGPFRVTTIDARAPECALPPGRYTMAIRDAASRELIASGTVDLEAP